MEQKSNGVLWWSFRFATVVIIVYTGTVCMNYVPTRIHQDVHTFTSTIKKLPWADTIYKVFYDDAKCNTEHSRIMCSFPLLTDYHRRCGYFPGSTRWTRISAGFPQAKMLAQICRVPPVSSAPSRLSYYIRERDISAIALFGDSQGRRYSDAFLSIVNHAGFRCKTQKAEPPGFHIHLNYYTEGHMFTPNDTVSKTCRSCNSKLLLCDDETGRHLSVEYISIMMASSTPLGGHCNDSHHPLCQNITQQEYVLKHYLRRTNNYPQLLLFFSTFPHNRMTPQARTYDGMRYLYKLITRYVPTSANVIWYNAPAWHTAKFVRPWRTYEGWGYSPNDKMQAQNKFLSKLQILHHESGNTPAMYSFFDLYHMDEQLKGSWVADKIHYNSSWYAYVMGYTAAMLPSIPVS